MPEVREADFAALFNAHFDSLLAYTRRRAPQLADAEDAMAETYVVAWRRFTELPADAQGQRLWLFGLPIGSSPTSGAQPVGACSSPSA
jgi:RNA polymerase sigma-70 factor, ECF subfamily